MIESSFMKRSIVLACALLSACGQDSPPAQSPIGDAPVLATRESRVQHPSALIPLHGTLTVSRANCFSLNDSGAVLFAPFGSTVSPDGAGVIVKGREYRLGQPLDGLGGDVVPLGRVTDPTAALLSCQPERVAVVADY